MADRQTDRQTDRPSDHAIRSVTVDCIYVRSSAMRLNNKYSVNVNGAAIMTVAIARVLQVHFMNGDSVPGGRRSSN